MTSRCKWPASLKYIASAPGVASEPSSTSLGPEDDTTILFDVVDEFLILILIVLAALLFLPSRIFSKLPGREDATRTRVCSDS
jgi:hypothetical protein